MEPNAGVSNDKGMAYIAYILFFVPLIAGTKSEFVKYHTNQGTVLAIFTIALQIVLSFFTAIPLLGLLLHIAQIIPFILWIIGLINVSKGEMKPLPLIGHITIVK